MEFQSLPSSACWQHEGLRSGFEVAYFSIHPSGMEVTGTTTGFQDGDSWIVTYKLQIDNAWRTRSTHIQIRTAGRIQERTIESVGHGSWVIDGKPADQLTGCLDVDLESSAMTNALPVHRLGLPEGASAAAPAVYVRVGDGAIERLEQTYSRIKDRDGHQRYDYEAAQFDFRCQLVYDKSGLVLTYPGIASRAE